MWVVAAALLGIFVLAHAAPFRFVLDTGRQPPSMWRVPASPGAATIYLTFDDGPNPRATPALLDVLARERVRATFFLIERYVTDDTAPIVRRMFDEGHGVALHSDRRWLLLGSADEIAGGLQAFAARLEQIGGRAPCRAFRPHAGFRSDAMYGALARLDYTFVGWSWRAWDWNWFRTRTPESVVERVLKQARDGAIVVIHDGWHKRQGADRQYAVSATAALAPRLRERGFAFATICEAIERPRT